MHGASPHPKRGVGSHVEKGWDPPGPTAFHRTRFGSHVEKSWDPPGPTEPNLGPTVENSADPPGPTKYVSGHVQGWWFEGTIQGPENAHASGFNIVCLHSII